MYTELFARLSSTQGMVVDLELPKNNHILWMVGAKFKWMPDLQIESLTFTEQKIRI